MSLWQRLAGRSDEGGTDEALVELAPVDPARFGLRLAPLPVGSLDERDVGVVRRRWQVEQGWRGLSVGLEVGSGRRVEVDEVTRRRLAVVLARYGQDGRRPDPLHLSLARSAVRVLAETGTDPVLLAADWELIGPRRLGAIPGRPCQHHGHHELVIDDADTVLVGLLAAARDHVHARTRALVAREDGRRAVCTVLEADALVDAPAHQPHRPVLEALQTGWRVAPDHATDEVVGALLADIGHGRLVHGHHRARGDEPLWVETMSSFLGLLVSSWVTPREPEGRAGDGEPVGAGQVQRLHGGRVVQAMIDLVAVETHALRQDAMVHQVPDWAQASVGNGQLAHRASGPQVRTAASLVAQGDYRYLHQALPVARAIV